MTRLSSDASLNLAVWAQLNKTSSSSANTPLPLAAAPVATTTVSNLTATGSSATLFTVLPQTLQVGDKVTIAGASLAAYNGTFPILTVVNTSRYIFTLGSSPVSPAVGLPLFPNIIYYGKVKPDTQAGINGVLGTSIISLTSTGGVATAATTLAHGLKVGDMINVRNAMDSNYNGNQQVASIVDTTHFTYAVANSPVSPATIVAAALTFTVPQTKATRFTINAAAANTAAITFGPDSTATFASIPAGTGYLIESPPDKIVDLSAWYFASTAASQSIVIGLL